MSIGDQNDYVLAVFLLEGYAHRIAVGVVSRRELLGKPESRGTRLPIVDSETVRFHIRTLSGRIADTAASSESERHAMHCSDVQ